MKQHEWDLIKVGITQSQFNLDYVIDWAASQQWESHEHRLAGITMLLNEVLRDGLVGFAAVAVDRLVEKGIG